MAKGRRNKKVAIAEDNVAVASQIALPSTPVKSRAPLVEIVNPEGGATIEGTAPEETSVDPTQIVKEAQTLQKVEKAAIGQKKNKKKNRKRDAKEEPVPDVNIEHQSLSHDNPVTDEPVTTEEVLNSSNKEVEHACDEHEQEAQPPTIDTMKSPGKSLAEVEAIEHQEANRPADKNEDSFIEHIIARSPAKPVPRIEDSVEALDKLEDAMDALDEVAAAQKMVSKKQGGQDVNKGKTTRSKKPVKRPASLLPPKQAPKSTKPVTLSTFELPGEAVARKLKEQREAREAKRQSIVAAPSNPKERKEAHVSTSAATSAPRVKSTKPPTKSTFELPGEAVSRRLKEQREAREAKRQSLAGVPGTLKDKKDGHHPSAAVNTTAPRVKSTKPPTKPTFELPGEAISRKRREQQETRRKLMEEEEEKKRVEARSKPLRLAAEEQERVKKEREAAAKKAREEAAERGRQASREWAEKHKKKVVAAK